MMGHKKAKVEIKNNIATISVRGLPKGIYVLNINIDGQIEGHQVIVE
ncbi:T9SS type A sorting domain-containing protein [Flavobacterium sandaracinum]|uniref:T9SS type A sorting domain-containing protein n=1 Tax=Flavobacterium sandaracinum TaxID=2541733 RepID=A0A4R5CJK6_9FLAO|nr:T9SS type A sorting domain-containing protein [Flavobacterium sandaracinum]